MDVIEIRFTKPLTEDQDNELFAELATGITGNSRPIRFPRFEAILENGKTVGYRVSPEIEPRVRKWARDNHVLVLDSVN